MDPYDLGLVILGLAALLVAVLPRLLRQHHPSFPIVFVALGAVLGFASFPVGVPGPLEAGVPAERLTELGVILALTVAGLQIDRPVGLRRWATTWRLLFITMPLTVAGIFMLGWWALGLVPAGALLIAACLSPTDPVLASDVQVGRPAGEHQDDEVRVALTGEAGLNDGLAFPYTLSALHVAAAGALMGGWILEWSLVDVVYRIGAGVVVGLAVGWPLSLLLFRLIPSERIFERTASLLALAVTFTAYGLTELTGGYGFIGVFVAARSLRRLERHHEYHKEMHDVAQQSERFVAAVILLLFGAMLAGGLLAPLTWETALVGLAIVFLVRPMAGMVGLLGGRGTLWQRGAIAFFGIRGIATFYYLSYALNRFDFADGERLWALAGFVVLTSIVVHGATAGPALRNLASREG